MAKVDKNLLFLWASRCNHLKMCPGEKDICLWKYARLQGFVLYIEVLSRKSTLPLLEPYQPGVGFGRGCWVRMVVVVVVKKLEHPLAFLLHIRVQKRLKNYLEGHKQRT